MTTNESREYDRDDLPKGQTRFVIREEDVTIVIQGDAETVRQRFNDYLDETLGIDRNTLDDLPHPDPGERLVPAEEFYADSD
jgi:hypothetical protein